VANEGSQGFSTVGRAAAAVSVLLVLGFAAWLIFGGSESYVVKARFRAAGQLVPGNLVQIAGRPVGTTGQARLTPDGQAEVDLKIDDQFAPLRAGTQATIRQASLSGVANRYVDLQMPPGESQEEIPDGGVIPIQDTTTAVDLDQLFSLFDDKARKGLRNVIRGFGQSYAGKSEDASVGWEYLNPSLVAARRLFAELDYDDQALKSFLVSNSKLVSDLADRRDDVAALVDNLATTLDAIGSEKTELQRAIGVLPDFMRRANTTFVNLRSTLDDLDPLIEESKPVTPKLRAVLAELRPFARQAGPTFVQLADLVKKGGKRNDLIDLANSVFGFRDVTVREQTVNGEVREGSFPAAARSLKDQTPQWAFQRPYAPDLTGWFDDFSHSGIYDANGSASRVSTTVNAFAFVNGTLGQLIPPELRPQVFKAVASLGQRNRCPGSTERPFTDKSNPYKPSPDYNCDETQIPPGN
jgi:phospholipid/cholesterol/gamma-HCH transport system substrate-binding protein